MGLLSRSAAVTLLLASATRADAATYDPDLRWRTLRTEHFDIHFHQGIEQVADEFSDKVEVIYDTMVEELQWEPQVRTQVTLIDRTDIANGFATSVPYNAITIYVTAPTGDSSLNLYEDWSTAIFTHELTHVLHIEANHGLVRAARAVVGRIASTNGVSPGWMIEGLATFQETRHTPGGRGRAAWPDMIKRTSVAEDAFPPLGNLDGYQPAPPAGNLRYLFGQDFISYIADHTGEDVWTRWVHTYGSGVPFLLPAKRVFGQRLVPLYFDWKEHLFAHYGAQIAAVRDEGETIGRLVSDPEASCSSPSFSPDGDKLVWSCYDLRTGSALWMSDGMGYAGEVLLQDFGAGNFTWRADSKAFVYASNHIVNRFNVWSDIYLYTLGGGTSALTSGQRARDPDFSPDGTELLYVTNRAQNNQLQVTTVDRRNRALTDNDDHTQYSTPRHSPDGRAVAVSVWKDGQRDLWLYSRDGAPLRRLTMDAAIDVDPAWSHDGEWLYFTSDRSGIPNVYAIALQTEELYQVTNVVTGAARPAPHPSGDRIAYQQYSQDGWDIRVLDLDPERFLPRGTLPQPLRYGAALADLVGPVSAEPAGDAAEMGALWDSGPREPGRPGTWGARPEWLPRTAAHPQDPDVLDNFQDTEVEDVFGEEEDYPFQIEPRRYNPFPTLLPRYLLPFLQTTPYRPAERWGFTCIDERVLCPGIRVSAVSSATDALRRYAWSASINYRTDGDYLGGSASFVINRFLPVYSFGVSTGVSPTANLVFFDPDAPPTDDDELALFNTDPPTLYWDKRTTAAATVSWPYRLRSTVFARYSFTDRRPRFALPNNVHRPSLPLIGLVGALSGGWRYAWSQQTPYAISAEDARSFSFVGSLLSPALGTFVRDAETGGLEPLTQVQATAEIREYRVMPWASNHVLAGRAAGGVTFGGNDFLGNYLLGGSIGDSSFTVTPDSLRMLRGYPFAHDSGDMYWLGSLEYRLPIWRPERGFGTLPAYARNLSAAAFIDAGNAFNSPSLLTGVGSTADEFLQAAIDEPLVGVGAELTFRTVMLWSFGLQGRLGYAIGLTPGGRRVTDGLAPAYLRLGGSF